MIEPVAPEPRSMIRNGAMPTGYRLELRSDSPTVKLQRCVNSDCGSGTPIASGSHTMTTEPQRLRYQAYGQNIRVKVWAASQPEPVNWTIDVTDSAIQGAGVLQIAHNFDTASHAVLVDDLTYWKLV